FGVDAAMDHKENTKCLMLLPVAPTTTEQRLARKNELKARGTLLMALPDKHQLKFNSHKDAKILMEAIEKRFGLDQIHNRLQKLVSQLEIHEVSVSQEDVNLKFLHSLPSEWKTHTLIWQHKADLEPQSLNDLFNSLKIYEAEVKQSSSIGTASQNLAFVSSSHIDSTTDSVSVAASVSTACVKLPASPLPNVDSLSNAVIYSFFASQSTSSQLDNKDLKQIDVDDLEEMDLRWQMAMLTMWARRKGYFARECRSPKDPRRPSATEPPRRIVPVETSTSNALVSQCNGTRGYDCSYQVDEEPTNFALMDFSSNSSSDNETGLESVKARLLVYKQNESIFEENIKLLNIKVQLRDTALVTLRQKLEKAEQERDDLKLKLEKFQTSSKNLIDLLAKSDCESWPPSNLYDRFQPSGGYHVVPPPYTGTFMPSKLDLVFHSVPTAVETDHLTFNVQLSLTKPEQALSHTTRPSAPIIKDWVSDSEEEYETKALQQLVPSFAQSSKHVKTPRQSVKQIKTTIPATTTVPTSPKSNSSGKSRSRKACFVCKSVDHLIKEYDYHTKKMTQPTQRNYAHRGHHKQYALLPHSQPQTHQVPTVVFTKSKPVLNTAVKPVNAARPNITVTRLRNYHQVVTKSKSPIQSDGLGPKKNLTIQFVCRELNGGYVAFGGNPKGGKITSKGTIKTGKLDFDDVYFVKELKFNLFSVSQMYDKKNSVLFTDTECLVLSFFKLPDASQVLLRVPRENNMYNVNLKNIVPFGDLTCLFAKATLDESNLWHRRLAYIHLGVFLAIKDETTPILKTFLTGLENQLSLKVKVIRSDNGTEFKNFDLNQFCGLKGIKREFSVPRTPQQNGITKRKNRTLIEENFKGRLMKDFLLDTLLTRTMNYHPVTAGNQTHSGAGFQDIFDAEKAGEEVNQSYMLFPVWSSGSTNPQNNTDDAAFDGKEHDFDVKKPESQVILFPSSNAQSKDQDDPKNKEAKCSKAESGRAE
nr:ribonuclease H-like domain-containing protein [Tanacetum cinerariifolium]